MDRDVEIESLTGQSIGKQHELISESIASINSSKGCKDEDNVSFFKSRASTTEFCRICHDVDSAEALISPCSCRGSISFVHRSCIERWLAESDTHRCDLCGFNFNIKRLPKFGVVGSVWTWLTSSSTRQDRKALLVDLLIAAVLSPALAVVNFFLLPKMDDAYFEPEFVLTTYDGLPQGHLRTVYKRNVEVQEETPTVEDSKFYMKDLGKMVSTFARMGLISVLVTFDMAFFSWVLIKMQYHFLHWYAWYRRNCLVTLVGVPEPSTAPQVGPSVEEATTA